MPASHVEVEDDVSRSLFTNAVLYYFCYVYLDLKLTPDRVSFHEEISRKHPATSHCFCPGERAAPTTFSGPLHHREVSLAVA